MSRTFRGREAAEPRPFGPAKNTRQRAGEAVCDGLRPECWFGLSSAWLPTRPPRCPDRQTVPSRPRGLMGKMATGTVFSHAPTCREAPWAAANRRWQLERFASVHNIRQTRRLIAPAQRVAQRSDDTILGESSGALATLSPAARNIGRGAAPPSPDRIDEQEQIFDSYAVRDKRRTYREHDIELQESIDDPGCSGRVGQVTFFGPAGRTGRFGHVGVGERKMFRRHRLDNIRVELEEAESMNTILVGKRRQMFSKAVRSSEGRRPDPQPPSPTSSSKSENRRQGRKKRQTGAKPKKPSMVTSRAPPGEEMGNVVAHNFDLSGSSIKRIMKPGFALSVAPGVILPILPNIMAINGPLGIKEMEEMASQRVLSSVLTLEVPKELCSISLDGDTRKFRRSIQFKAAALSRLVARAEQRHSPSYVILLQCWNPTMQPVAQLIAAWLHWYYHMGIEEACARAGAACGCYVPRALLDEANEDLFVSAKIRANRGRLVWSHGAYLARVAGDVVGSWCPRDMKLVSRRDKELYGLREGDWVLQLPDLEPGQYRYKYVVDEHWRVDWKQPHRLDEHSNWNNIWEVPANQPFNEYTPERKLDVIRKEFMSLALRVKMKLEPKLLAK